MTAEVGVDVTIETRVAGADEYISKYGGTSLLPAIAKALGKLD